MRRLVFLLLMMSLGLAGCFRDAGEDRGETTSIDVESLISSPVAPSPTVSQVATLTATPQIAPTNTFPVGGPPVNTAVQVTSSPSPTIRSVTVSPTILIPSFTPNSNTFGDSGVTPTSNLPTPPIPEGLITPTAFDTPADQECIHLVEANETLFRIALEYNVTPEEFVAANPELGGNPNALQIGQSLRIPNCNLPTPTATATTEGAPAVTDATSTTSAPAGTESYTVQAGDNLFRISVQFNTTVDAILAANPQLGGSDLIQPGQVLVIPSGQ